MNMAKGKTSEYHISRRNFLEKTATALAGVAAAPAVLFGAPSSQKNTVKTGSVINGVKIGVIAPYAFRNMHGNTVEELLDAINATGISMVEMQIPPVESFLGAPSRDDRETLSRWRETTDLDGFKDLRQMYNDAGVDFYGFKEAITHEMSDAECDYLFNATKSLGAWQLTMELPRNDDDGTLTNRIGQLAAKHQILVAYHNHTQANYNFWDRAIWQSEYNGLNLDIGHYVAGTNENPIPLIERHWDRIGSLHLKDRKKNNGDNMPWGQGDTPIAEVLQLMRDRNAEFVATIELEYPVPDGSDAVQEIKKCFEYCRQALA
jgi:sugar phosphate isomerase/epimerase